MRKIHHNNLVRFFYGNLENIISEPYPDVLKIKPGDILRFLTNKYEIDPVSYSDLSVCLLPFERPAITPIADRIPVANIGTIRAQESENYAHFKIKVGGFKANTRKQFTLTAENNLFVPFSYNGDSLADLMDKLAAHIEAIPYTVVRTKVNGPIMDVYVMHSNSMHLASDLTVELGPVTGTNQNAPSLTATLLSTGVVGANKDYQMVVSGTIVEGNEFSFNGVLFRASKGTTAADIVNYYTAGSTVNFLDSDTFLLSFQPGSVTKQNSNIPAITAFKSATVSGNDKYLIRLAGQYQVGNVLTVFTSARTITHVWAAGDTITSVQALLNPDSGFFSVIAGTQVSVKALPGTTVTPNDNTVQFYLNAVAIYPSQTREKYGVTVGSDVIKGNEFKISDPDNDVDFSVIATSEDTNFTIAEKISGGSNPYFIYDRLQKPGAIIFSASPGLLYTEEDILEVSVVMQPTTGIPDQCVCEIVAPEYGVVPRGRYILALRDNLGVRAIACVVDYNDHEFTSVIEVSDTSNVFGFNYAEAGITQRYRADLWLKTEFPEVTETVGQNLDGVSKPINVRIEYKSKFATRAISLNTAKALMSMLKSDFVRVNDVEIQTSDVTYSVLSEFGKACQVFGTATRVNEYLDNHDRMIYPQILSGSNAVVSADYSFGLRLFLRNSTFTKEIIAETAIPANGYFLEVIASSPSKGFVRLLVRDQQNVLVEMEIDKSLKHRSIPFRIQPGAKVVIELKEVSEILNSGFNPIEAVDVEVIYVNEFGEPIGGAGGSAFDEGFDEGFD